MKPQNLPDLIRLLTCIFTLFLCPASLYAEDLKKDVSIQLTLEDANREALEHNQEIVASSEELNAAHGQLVTAKTWENPELSVGPGMKRLPASGGDNEERFFHGSAELNQLILFPGKRALQIAIAEHDSKASELALEGLKNQISFKVLKSFYGLLAAEELVKLRNSQIKSAKIFSESSRKRVESGYGSDVDAVRGEAELILSQKLLLDAETQVITAKAALNTILGRSADVQIIVKGDLESFKLPLLPKDYLEEAFFQNPAYKAQLIKAKKAGVTIDAAKLSKAPDFRVGPFVEYGKDEQIYGLGISLPLTLWDTKSGEIASATAMQRKEIAEAEKLRLEIVEAVTSAVSNLKAVEQQRALYSQQFITRLKDSMNSAEKAYESNGTTLLIYLDAKRTYFETIADYYETLAKLPGAYAELESALGVPLNNQ